jgi:hypothetical protein
MDEGQYERKAEHYPKVDLFALSCHLCPWSKMTCSIKGCHVSRVDNGWVFRYERGKVTPEERNRASTRWQTTDEE